MGRKRKEIKTASEESIRFTLKTIKRYAVLKDKVENYEATRKSLLDREKFDYKAFRADNYPSTEMMDEKRVPAREEDPFNEYLFALESTYLLEHGIFTLGGELSEMAADMFLKKLTRDELEAKWCISQSALTRKRKEALNGIALETDYFFWLKVQHLYG